MSKPKQFRLRFPLFVWRIDKTVVLQTWECLAPEGIESLERRTNDG
jgi:hypothetical protein